MRNSVSLFQLQELFESLAGFVPLKELHLLQTQIAECNWKVRMDRNGFTQKLNCALRVSFRCCRSSLLILSKSLLGNTSKGRIRCIRLEVKLDCDLDDASSGTGLAIDIDRFTSHFIFLVTLHNYCIAASLYISESKHAVLISYR